MTRLPLLLLGLLAAGLAATIVRQLDDTVTDPIPVAARPPAAAADARPGGAVPANATAAAGRVATILARPLFALDRRPSAVPAPGGALAAGGAEPPRLAGILIGPAGRSAIFAGAEEGPVVLREGGMIGSYTVRDITPAQVTVLGPAGPQVLRPAFDGAPPSARPAGPAAGSEASFARTPVPSGLDILRNAARNAPPQPEDAPPPALPGVDRTGEPPAPQGSATRRTVPPELAPRGPAR